MGEEKQKYLPVFPVSNEGTPFFIGLKNVAIDDPRLPSKTDTGTVAIEWTKQFLPSHWVATMLKAAHLTMFKLIGYRAVFDPSGDSLRRVLASYYYDNASREDAPGYFRPFLNSVKVARVGNNFNSPGSAQVDLDTLRDRKLIFHYQGEQIFAATLVYKLIDKTLTVTIPQTTSLDDIGMATRFYNRLMAEDPELNQTTRIVQLKDEGWLPVHDFRMRYERSAVNP